jgi:hypothetical protein
MPRFQALESGRVKSYFAYAAGEIALIFIGITLALGFNGWSEARERDALERTSLQELLSSLEANDSALAENVRADVTYAMAAQRVIDHLEHGAPWNDSLGGAYSMVFYFASPYFTTAAYEQLKARGLDIISDDTIRVATVHLYETSYQYLTSDIDRFMWMIEETTLLPSGLANLRWEAGKGWLPVDIAALRQNRSFLSTLELKRQVIEGAIVRKGRALTETRQLEERVKTALEG